MTISLAGKLGVRNVRQLWYSKSILIGSLLLSTPVVSHAQAVGDQKPTESADSLMEITVTAQRRSERLQDVPLTVNVVSGDALATQGVNNVADLALVVPGLKVGNSVGFATTHLRGIGSTALGPGIENPIAIYVDGVYYASAESSLFDFLNVDSVEVLKGPQGTLFGRNATGGLIQVITREPTQETRIDADIGFANYQAGRADFYIGGWSCTQSRRRPCGPSQRRWGRLWPKFLQRQRSLSERSLDQHPLQSRLDALGAD